MTKEIPDHTLRLYSILRHDLHMNSGKSIAQAGHCYINAFLQTLKLSPETIDLYQDSGLGTKICLAAKNLRHLEDIESQLQDHNIPYSKIIDSGHIHLPHFDGSRVVTGLGIGPCIRVTK